METRPPPLSLHSLSPMTGMTSTLAKLVCRAALALNGDRRTRRCVPRSAARRPYACRPPISSSTDLMPASSPGARSRILKLNPCAAAHRVYMRSSMAAQSWASVPPAPDWTVRTASPASHSPPSRARSSQAASADSREDA